MTRPLLLVVTELPEEVVTSVLVVPFTGLIVVTVTFFFWIVVVVDGSFTVTVHT